MLTVPSDIKDLNPRCVLIKKGQKGPSERGWPNTTNRVNDVDWGNLDEQIGSYGIVLDDDMLVIDVDVHDGQENGFESLSRLSEDIGTDLWECAELVVRSPSGGAHLYFSKDPDEKFPGRLEDYPAIDILSKGKQVIGPGSSHAQLDGVYKIEKSANMEYYSELRLSDFSSVIKTKEPEISSKPAVQVDSSQESPIDDFNQNVSGMLLLKNEMTAKGYEFRCRGDGTYTFTRPGKTDFTYSISGTLGRLNQQGIPMLVNFSTNDPYLPADSGVNVAEGYRLIKGLDRATLPLMLRDLGFGGGHEDYSWVKEEIKLGRNTGKELEESYPTSTFDDVAPEVSKRRPYVIKGLLRRGETMNLVAPPKVGKSWFVHNLCAHMANDRPFLGFEPNSPVKCLIVDNELHEEEIVHRMNEVRKGMGLRRLGKGLEFTCLRGCKVDINTLKEKLVACGAGRFDVIVLDALYRFLPEGASENDNAQMMAFYNQLDEIASQFSCSLICVHHTSKGSQKDKGVTDAGSGAGSISRAADAQCVIYKREQGEEGYAEGWMEIKFVTRSSPEPSPVVVARTGTGFAVIEGASLANAEKVTAVDRNQAAQRCILEWLTDNPDGFTRMMFQEVSKDTRSVSTISSSVIKPMCQSGLLKKDGDNFVLNGG